MDDSDIFRLRETIPEAERALAAKVRRFCDDRVLPVINQYWERAEFPFPLLEPLAALGVTGGTIQGYGCPGFSPLGSGLVSMELARGDGSLSTFMGVQSGLVMNAIALLGSEEQKERLLPPLARLERIGAFALTEPQHGSDVVALETTARRLGDGYVLNGAKRWIGNAVFADDMVVWARDAHDDVGAYVVNKGAAGVEMRLITGKIAKRASWQADITFTDVHVEAENRLEHSHTFADAARVLTAARPNIAWGALGHAQAAYDLAVAYCHERESFGQPIAATQLVQFRLAKMLAGLTSMWLVCLRLAELVADDVVTPAMASMAKMHNAEQALRITAEARDLLGGNGILLENHVARHFVDAQVVSTVEGTDSVHALIVGRDITGMSAFT